jgi:carbonic anhydrase
MALPCLLRTATVLALLTRSAAQWWTTTLPPLPPTDYSEHGADWKAGVCRSRERQSPINFDDHFKDPPNAAASFHYEKLTNTRLFLQARNELLFIDMSEKLRGGVKYASEFYALTRIEFHSPAEHTLKGKRMPLELQLHHRSMSDPSKNLVVAIIVWSEHNPTTTTTSTVRPGHTTTPIWNPPYFPPSALEVDFNMQLQNFINAEPPNANALYSTVTIPFGITLDLNLLVANPFVLPSSIYIEYAGSQTSPPCTDKTIWLVRRTMMVASDSQMQVFAKAVYDMTANKGNFRTVMPQNNRILNVVNMLYTPTISLAPPPTPQLFLGPNPRTDDEFSAAKMAAKARRVSAQAVDYMADFATRLRTASAAQAAAVTPASTPPPQIAPMNMWDQAVYRTRLAVAGTLRGVKMNVDQMVRDQTMKVHAEAASQARVAHDIVMRAPAILPTTTPEPTTTLYVMTTTLR